MDRSSDLAAVRSVASAGLGIIGAVNCSDIALFILVHTGACYKVCMHQTHLVAGIQPAVLADRDFHEVLLLDVEFLPERNLSGTQFRILQIVLHIQFLDLIFRIVVDDQLQRMQDRHDAGSLQLQVFSHAVLKHLIVRH